MFLLKVRDQVKKLACLIRRKEKLKKKNYTPSYSSTILATVISFLSLKQSRFAWNLRQWNLRKIPYLAALQKKLFKYYFFVIYKQTVSPETAISMHFLMLQ